MVGKIVIQSPGAPKAIGPYSQAIQMDGWLYLSGQIPLTAQGELVTHNMQQQTKQVLENLGAVLKRAGVTWKNVVKTTVYMTDLNEFQSMNEVYAQYFQEQPPARATVQVSGLPKGARVEIDAIARIP